MQKRREKLNALDDITVLSSPDFSQMSQGTQLLPMYWLFLHFNVKVT